MAIKVMFPFVVYRSSISCRLCEAPFRKVALYVRHLQEHRHLIGSSFPCAVRPCARTLGTESALRCHLAKGHGLRIASSEGQALVSLPVNRSGKLVCSLPSCSTEFDSKRALMSHLGVHMRSGRSVKCPFPSCSKVYSVLKSMTGHVSRSHCEVRPLVETSTLDPDGTVDEVDLMQVDESLTQEEVMQVSENINEKWKNSLADFFMKLQFKCLIPESTVQIIAEEMSLLQKQTFSCLLGEGSGMNQDKLMQECLKKMHERMTTLEAGLSAMRTAHRRLSFYTEHYLFVAPEKKDMKPKDEMPRRFFFYVSIKKTLQKMMQGKNCVIDLNAPRPSSDGVLRDYYDGVLYKRNEFFRCNPKSFRIMLFQDAFEPANPLGSAKRKYKMLGVYMSLGNIPKHLRGHSDTIQLVALCIEKDLVHDKFFGAIADELKELETEGVFIPGHGFVKGSLLFVCGDNLGSHGVGGFHEQFTSSRYFCRYCLADRQTFKNEQHHHMEYPIRTPENYNIALRGRTIAQPKGIKFDSRLNSLNFYHVCNPGLPPCLGHDIMEGIASHDVACALHYLIDEEWFTVEDLNKKIEGFPYSKVDRRDKPLPFKAEYLAIKGKMWQIYNSIRLFPIMLSDYVQDEFHPAWQMLLLLGKMLDLICAPAMHVSWVPYVRDVIWEYMDLRTSFLPWIPLRPKHHYLTHYWMMIFYFGPLGLVWTLRFESKHSFFKNHVRSSKNYINILSSRSNRHELFQAYLRAGGDTRCETQTFKPTPFCPASFSNDVVNAVRRAVSLAGLQLCVKAIHRGTVYEKGNLVPLGPHDGEENVSFGRITLILLHEDSCLFFLLEVLTSEFSSVSRAYKLGPRKRLLCLPSTDLPSYSPLHSYRIGCKLLVKLKHSLVEHNGDGPLLSSPCM